MRALGLGSGLQVFGVGHWVQGLWFNKRSELTNFDGTAACDYPKRGNHS